MVSRVVGLQVVVNAAAVHVATVDGNVHDVGPVFHGGGAEQAQERHRDGAEVERVVAAERHHARNREDVKHQKQQHRNVVGGFDARNQTHHNLLQLLDFPHQLQEPGQAKQPQNHQVATAAPTENDVGDELHREGHDDEIEVVPAPFRAHPVVPRGRAVGDNLDHHFRQESPKDELVHSPVSAEHGAAPARAVPDAVVGRSAPVVVKARPVVGVGVLVRKRVGAHHVALFHGGVLGRVNSLLKGSKQNKKGGERKSYGKKMGAEHTMRFLGIA